MRTYFLRVEEGTEKTCEPFDEDRVKDVFPT